MRRSSGQLWLVFEHLCGNEAAGPAGGLPNSSFGPVQPPPTLSRGSAPTTSPTGISGQLRVHDTSDRPEPVRFVVLTIGGRYGVRILQVLSARSHVPAAVVDRKSTRLNSSHSQISYAVFCLKKKKNKQTTR